MTVETKFVNKSVFYIRSVSVNKTGLHGTNKAPVRTKNVVLTTTIQIATGYKDGWSFRN